MSGRGPTYLEPHQVGAPGEELGTRSSGQLVPGFGKFDGTRGLIVGAHLATEKIAEVMAKAGKMCMFGSCLVAKESKKES
jgi:hypothetical protein